VYLIPIDQYFPGFDKSLPSKVLIIRGGITVLVQNIANIFVKVWNKVAELGP